MNVVGGRTPKPRWEAWLVVLVGLVTVAHLWTHATTPRHHPVQLGVLMVDSCPDHPVHDHHDGSFHPDAFMLPVWDCATTAQAPITSVVSDTPSEPASATGPASLTRAPPHDHRGRAVLTHTLEICRC
ncbi:hypothetical protein [Sphaerisporangium fuscum]|uniref:hypothetical protein n=1 Tax=Sphaerisporangium fuscum TaxID=2835868 RepID=UPI001BDD2FC1|nr:hypothetical protein [Sphaerisporangium fuscum]